MDAHHEQRISRRTILAATSEVDYSECRVFQLWAKQGRVRREIPVIGCGVEVCYVTTIRPWEENEGEGFRQKKIPWESNVARSGRQEAPHATC